MPNLAADSAEGAAPPGSRFTTFSSLRLVNYRWYMLGMLAMFSSVQMELLVRGWLVYDMTGSSLLLGLVTGVWGIPIVVLSLVGGAIADRVDKRRLLIFTQLGTAFVTAVLSLLIYTEVIQWWHFMVAALFQGVLFALNAPARMSIIPELVGDRGLMNAISLNSAGMNVTRILAPALGGILLAAIKADGVYFLILALNVVSVAFLVVMSTEGRAAPALRQPWGADLREGLGFIRSNSTILSLLALALVPMIFAMPYLYLMPVFAADVLKVGEAGLGWLMTMIGVGGLVGSLSIASLAGFRHKGWLLLALTSAFGISLALFALSHIFALSLVFLTLVGAASIGYMSLNNTLLQIGTPHHLRGRVLGLWSTTFGLMPLGALPVGAVAEVLGAPLTVGIGGLMVVLLTLGMGVLRPQLRRLE